MRDCDWQRWLRCCAAASECRDFSRACQPRRWEGFQTGVSGVRADWYTIRPLPREESRLSACGFRAGTLRKKPGFGQSPAFGTGGPGGDVDCDWQRSLRCRAAASECRDFSRACQPRRWEGSQAGVSGVRAAWYTIRPLPREESRLSACGFRAGTLRKKPGFGQSPAFGTGGPGGDEDCDMAAVVAVLCCRIRMPGFFARLKAAAVGGFSGRRIGCPGGLVHDPAVAARRIPAFCVWVQSGHAAEKAGLRAKPGIWDRRPGW